MRDRRSHRIRRSFPGVAARRGESSARRSIADARLSACSRDSRRRTSPPPIRAARCNWRATRFATPGRRTTTRSSWKSSTSRAGCSATRPSRSGSACRRTFSSARSGRTTCRGPSRRTPGSPSITWRRATSTRSSATRRPCSRSPTRWAIRGIAGARSSSRPRRRPRSGDSPSRTASSPRPGSSRPSTTIPGSRSRSRSTRSCAAESAAPTRNRRQPWRGSGAPFARRRTRRSFWRARGRRGRANGGRRGDAPRARGSSALACRCSSVTAPSLGFLAESYALVGTDDERRAVRERLADGAGDLVGGEGPFSYEGTTARLLGLLDASLGDLVGAETQLRHARALAVERRHAPWIAQTSYELGEVLGRAGRHVEARALLDECARSPAARDARTRKKHRAGHARSGDAARRRARRRASKPTEMREPEISGGSSTRGGRSASRTRAGCGFSRGSSSAPARRSTSSSSRATTRRASPSRTPATLLDERARKAYRDRLPNSTRTSPRPRPTPTSGVSKAPAGARRPSRGDRARHVARRAHPTSGVRHRARAGQRPEAREGRGRANRRGRRGARSIFRTRRMYRDFLLFQAVTLRFRGHVSRVVTPFVTPPGHGSNHRNPGPHHLHRSAAPRADLPGA